MGGFEFIENLRLIRSAGIGQHAKMRGESESRLVCKISWIRGNQMDFVNRLRDSQIHFDPDVVGHHGAAHDLAAISVGGRWLRASQRQAPDIAVCQIAGFPAARYLCRSGAGHGTTKRYVLSSFENDDLTQAIILPTRLQRIVAKAGHKYPQESSRGSIALEAKKVDQLAVAERFFLPVSDVNAPRKAFVRRNVDLQRGWKTR